MDITKIPANVYNVTKVELSIYEDGKCQMIIWKHDKSSFPYMSVKVDPDSGKIEPPYTCDTVYVWAVGLFDCAKVKEYYERQTDAPIRNLAKELALQQLARDYKHVLENYEKTYFYQLKTKKRVK